jgi:hypothetical protein
MNMSTKRIIAVSWRWPKLAKEVIRTSVFRLIGSVIRKVPIEQPASATFKNKTAEWRSVPRKLTALSCLESGERSRTAAPLGPPLLKARPFRFKPIPRHAERHLPKALQGPGRDSRGRELRGHLERRPRPRLHARRSPRQPRRVDPWAGRLFQCRPRPISARRSRQIDPRSSRLIRRGARSRENRFHPRSRHCATMSGKSYSYWRRATQVRTVSARIAAQCLGDAKAANIEVMKDQDRDAVSSARPINELPRRRD